MCTLALMFHVHPEFPVVVAANRDEMMARPWSPPMLLAPGVVGGRDDEKGGTWMGATSAGFFVAVTNQPTLHRSPTARSRGAIVLDALRAGATDKVLALLDRLDGRDFNAFNLLFGDATAIHVAYGRPDVAPVAIAPVSEGLHILANDVLDGQTPRSTRARTLFAPLTSLPWNALLDASHAALADPALCLRAPAYGTRSATLLALAPGRTAHYRFAAGPTDTTAFTDVMKLF